MTFSQQHAPFSDDQLAAAAQAEPGSLPALALPPSPFTFNANAASHVQAAAPAPAPAAMPGYAYSPVVDAPAPIEAALSGYAPVDYSQAPAAPVAQAPQAAPAPAQPAPMTAPPAFAPAAAAAPTPEFGGLQPAVPYRAPDRSDRPAPLMTTRPNTAQQFVSHPIAVPQNVPVPAPAPAAMQPYATGAPMAAPYGAPAQDLNPWPGQAPIAAPHAAPAAPSPAPGLGLAPEVAAVAAAPNAWFGGNVQSDESMLVWNGAGSATPAAPAALAAAVPAGLAASIAAGIPAGPPPGLAAAPGVAPLAAGVGVPAAGPDIVALAPTAEAVGGGSGALRWILFGAVPAALGIGIAVVLSQFVL